MTDFRHISLAVLFVLGTGITGCNENDNTTSQDKGTTNLKDKQITNNRNEYKGDVNTTNPGDENTTNSGDKNTTNSGDKNTTNSGDKNTTNSGDKNTTNSGDENTIKILSKISVEHNNSKSTITVAQLKDITPALNNINDDYEKWYQNYIEGDNNFSTPAKIEELQSMIDEVNDLVLPENAILDRNFYKKTNGKFEHKFIYLPVVNNSTGRTWLNNNLGAEYADSTNSNGNYNPEQQATASTDYLAYGSLFQWGRKADGHELMNWIADHNGTAKYGITTEQADIPDNSLFVTGSSDWRSTPDNTLWDSEASENNVCPAGYRLPLNPYGASDISNEFYQETQTWSSQDAAGALASILKIPMAGYRLNSNGGFDRPGVIALFWQGSWTKPKFYINSSRLMVNSDSSKSFGMSIRCIKEQTPSERSYSILLEIGNEHNSSKSTITVAQLKDITPALQNINDDYKNIYRSYIEAADNNFSKPATIEEIQKMIDEVNALSLPENAILDKNFFKKTRGKFEHRFVYLPVENNTTGKTWLNNNLGAWYAKFGSNTYNPAQQAKGANDNYAKGSLFQWGRKADGHEIVDGWSPNGAIDHRSTTTTKSDNPTDGKFIAVGGDWRVHPNADLWKGLSAPNNPCPTDYRVPTKEELNAEAQTWDSLDVTGSLSSLLKIPGPGWLGQNGNLIYYPGGVPRLWYASGGFAWTPKRLDSTQRTDGQPVRCIKN